jgi:hypothetical protein
VLGTPGPIQVSYRVLSPLQKIILEILGQINEKVK